MDLYKEEVMDHYEHPRNQGSLDDAQGGEVLTGRDSNASCGDMVQFSLRIGKSKIPNNKSEIIEDVKWKGIGCAITTAAASKLSEWLMGKQVIDIKKMDEEQMLKEAIGFEVNPGRIKCLTLPVRVVMKLLGS